MKTLRCGVNVFLVYERVYPRTAEHKNEISFATSTNEYDTNDSIKRFDGLIARDSLSLN